MISQVVKLYEKKYNEQLRGDWLLWIDGNQPGFLIDRKSAAVPVIKIKEDEEAASVTITDKIADQPEHSQSNSLKESQSEIDDVKNGVQTISRILEKVDIPNVIRLVFMF